MTADHHHPAKLAPIEARVAAIESVLVKRASSTPTSSTRSSSTSRTTSAR